MTALAKEKKMQSSDSNLFTRSDTLFGVCEGLGEDFGFHPNFLRVPFAIGLLWNPWVVIGTYLALGLVVALSRWLVPSRRSSKPKSWLSPPDLPGFSVAVALLAGTG